MKHLMQWGMIAAILFITGCSNETRMERVYSDSQWIEDITFLTEAVESKHPNPFNTITKDEWDNDIQYLINDVKKLSDRDISFRLQQIIAKVKDGHTSYYGTEMRLFEKVYPLKFHWYGSELRVSEVSNDDKALLGAKLISINHILLPDVIEKLNTISSFENNQWAKVNSADNISDYNILNFLDIVKKEEAVFEFETVNQERVSKKMSAVSKDENKQLVKVTLLDEIKPEALPLKNRIPVGANEMMWMSYEESDHLLYFQYNEAVSDQDPTLNQLSEQIQGLMKELMKEKGNDVFKFVIDLRYNTGGDSRGFSKLASSLTIYKDVYGFDVYTLIGPLTFSSGTLAAVDTKYYLDATFVGEETGGNNLAYGVFDYITLPNTQDTVAISTRNFNLGMGDYHGLLPDIEVIQSFESAIKGIDEAYEVIKAAN